AVASFFFGMVAGRYGGTRLVRAYSPAQLLVVSSFVSMIGFGMFWLGRFAAVNVAGLFLTGLGIANMYPLSFSAAVAAAAE
ncbi:hypothetical protein, partial [Pseudoalteromonas distincta]|uniref:hypothetical protein n=1 Tax=Pseudoalteromonas distincta TaxID=77608 RepID=UPI0034E8C506